MRTSIRHVVFFTAKDKEDVTRIVQELSQLEDIGLASCFEVRENHRVDQASENVDVVVYAEFPNREALEAYKAHPIYLDRIDKVRPLRDLRIAADF